MDKSKFNERLKELGLSKQEFAQISNVPYQTTLNWGVMRETKPVAVPNWVEPFLNYYEKAQRLELVMSEVCVKLQQAKENNNDLPSLD